MRTKFVVATAASLAMFAAAAPAVGQAWIGQIAAEAGRDASRYSCLGGKTEAATETLEAKTPALPLIRDFWARAIAARQTPETAAPLGAKWISGPTKTRSLNAAVLADPLSPSSSLSLADEPIGFERAGASPNVTAYGIWRVVSATDPSKTVGFYKAEFLRFMFKWQLQSVTALPPSPAPVVTPFCDEPGDIEKAQAREAERQRRKALKAQTR